MAQFDKAARIPCKLSSDFFKYWLMFTQPLHKLTPKIIDVAACILYHRHELSKVITDETVLNKYLMSTEMREKMMVELSIPQSNYHVAINKLKKARFLIDGNVNPRFIPNVKEGAKSFNFLLYFEFLDDEGENIQTSSE